MAYRLFDEVLAATQDPFETRRAYQEKYASRCARVRDQAGEEWSGGARLKQW